MAENLRISKNLVGEKVIILLGDFQPYDTMAKIVLIDEIKKRFLLELDKPVLNANKVYRHALACVRWPLNTINTLLYTAGEVGCNLTWIPEDKFNSKNPLDISWWRGGAADITTLRLIIKEE